MSENPVKKNKYGNYTDRDGRVGKDLDQYDTLKDFMTDIWLRYRPYGRKLYFEKVKLYQVEDTDELICKDKNSKFYNEKVENYYITRPDRYIKLKQHYKCNKHLHDIYSNGKKQIILKEDKE